MLITGAEVSGRHVDVRITGPTVSEIGTGLAVGGEDIVLAADGGVLLPGLHDHHLHLHAMAAALGSVRCGPPQVRSLDGLAEALRNATGGGWIRGVGYHESVGGVLGRVDLDRMVADRPVRVQHRSGALWMLNTKALETLDLLDSSSLPAESVERDSAGSATGRLWRGDHLLRDAVMPRLPDLAAVGEDLLALGITAVTDATPRLGADAADHLAQQIESGALPIGVLALGLDARGSDRLRPGPHKILLPDHDLPNLDDLVEEIRVAREADRGVAVHCVTRLALVLTLTALDLAGRHRDDRIEHAAVVPPEVVPDLANRDIAVVTQPGFVCDRGDSYLADVEPADRGHLYPYRSLTDAGVRVAPSSDAPYGDPDPWRAIAVAAERRTSTGVEIGPHERVPSRTALDGYLSPLERPGGPARRVLVGAPGDLCLLGVPLAEALAKPSRDNVALTIVGGAIAGGTAAR